MSLDIEKFILSSEGVYLHVGDEYIKLNVMRKFASRCGSSPLHIEVDGWCRPPVDMSGVKDDVMLEFVSKDAEVIVVGCTMSGVLRSDKWNDSFTEDNITIISVWSSGKSTLLYRLDDDTLYKVTMDNV